MAEDSNLHEKIGFMQADIKNVGAKVDSVARKLDVAADRMIQLTSETVKQGECTRRIRLIGDQISSLKDIVAKKQTRENNPSVASFLKDPSVVLQRMPEEKESSKKESFSIKLRDNLALVLTIITLFGIMLAGIIKLSHFVVGLETLVKQSESHSAQQTQTLRKEIKSMRPKVVYVPVVSDAGPDAKVKKPRRRR